MKKICVAIMIFIVFLLIFTACSGKEPTIPKNTSIDGVDVSEISEEMALKAMKDRHRKLLCELKYTIKAGSTSEVLSAEELGISFDTEGAVKAAMESGGKIETELVMDEKKARQAFEKLLPELSKKPVNAYAEYDSCGEFKFYEGKSGETPSVDSLIKALSEAITSVKSQDLIAEMNPTTPDGMTYAELVAQNSLIAEFTTFFNKSPQNAENRVKNIKKAAEKVNGTEIAAGERFDTNAILGDRTEENGWFKAPGIRNGKYELEYGGGVCQVSTTLYNAALLSNLEIVERTPHSWPVGYIDIGRDATISTGGPNLIFLNNTNTKLTIASIVNDDEQSITVKIFGSKPKSFDHIELSSEQTGTIPAPKTEFVKDPNLRIGEYITDRKARIGKTAATYRTFYDSNGEIIKTETVTRDTYKAFSAVVHYNN